MDEVPAAVRDAIRNGAASGRVTQVLKEIRAELIHGKVIKLDSPKYLYEAELVKGDNVAEIVVSPEGQIIEAPVWKKRDAKEAEPANGFRRGTDSSILSVRVNRDPQRSLASR